ISIALLLHRPPAAPQAHYLSMRFRALALFGRRPPERVVRPVPPASENLHKSGGYRIATMMSASTSMNRHKNQHLTLRILRLSLTRSFSHYVSNVSPPSFKCLSPLREKLVSLVDGCNA